MAQQGRCQRETPYNQGHFDTEQNGEGRPFPNFKTGALNRSATLPSLVFSDLAGVWVRGKHQSPLEGTAGHGQTGSLQHREDTTVVGRRPTGLVERQRE
jgi:hypothetical protein